jgi:hypothetical protein
VVRFLGALDRAIAEVAFEPSEDGAQRARRLRTLVVVVANGIRNLWQRRDSRGRWV